MQQHCSVFLIGMFLGEQYISVIYVFPIRKTIYY